MAQFTPEWVAQFAPESRPTKPNPMRLPEAKGNKPKAIQYTTPQQFDKEKEKKNRPRPEKKREKESPFNKAGGGGSQGFWNKNTTQRVEIFISKPEGLDLDGPLRGGCVSQP